MKNFIRSCHLCQICAPAPYLESPVDGRTRNVFELFKQFAIDFVGPLSVANSGARYILVGMEMFSRWPLAISYKKADAITATTFLYDEEIFTKFGSLTTILTDNGNHFAN